MSSGPTENYLAIGCEIRSNHQVWGPWATMEKWDIWDMDQWDPLSNRLKESQTEI